ncbi:Gfo/Idh/MocA family protein [Chelativorans xinjiangense]|uniref:Gfo/Idh/MocA family protein n=1 Tax=Chelativorans xinjiangense TaxID=2681485 RepID=UPI00135BDE5F|nr:Gfo/Idh/MocA family oxidoreductase [Chelativorans xinjiangense]
MINVGIIGAGHFGAVHARAVGRQAAARVHAVCSSDPAQAAAFAALHGGQPCRDWHALLNNNSVDAVVIATPHHMHTEIAVAAIEAGKHVLLEKPMAPTPWDCGAIEAAASRSNTILTIGHVMHFFRPIMVAREILASGRLGRPMTGMSSLVKLWMESNRRPWHLDPRTGGGMLMTAGIHALDQLVWLMDSRVAAVTALGGAFFHDQAADDTAYLGLRFLDGRIGQVSSIGYRDGAVSSKLQIVCEDGVLDVDLNSGVRVGQGTLWSPVADSWQADGMDEAVYREWTDFLHAIESGGSPPVDATYGRHIVEIVAAALASAGEHREILIDG